MAVDDCNMEKCTLFITGYLRAHSLSVNQLVLVQPFAYLWFLFFRRSSYFRSPQVHISGAGDYQLSKIEILKDPFPLNRRKDRDIMDSDEVHDTEVLQFYFDISRKG